MNSFEQFQEPQLPPKDVFYTSLTEVDICDRLHPHPNGVQPLLHGRPKRLSQLLPVNRPAFTGQRVREF